MAARVKLDAFDPQTFGAVGGTVGFISPDSDADAEPAPDARRPAGAAPKGASYTVKIDLARDVVGRGPHAGRVKLGMAGQVEIVTERENLLYLLVKKVRRSISLG
jgi:hypothetical protein